MASSSATPRRKYEVFLSFRGEDTRTNFTDHLYNALKLKGINTFRDEEKLEMGKPISELFKAIEESRFAVIVFSENYAGSKWCLDELAKIVECKEKREMTVLPVFYHVDPRDVRHQTGTFSFAEEIPRKRKICSMEKEQTWRAALTQVCELKGWHLGDGHETEIIREIVQEIFLKLHDKYPRAKEGLVGIDNQVWQLNCLLRIGSESDDVRVIGIWGMGGIGKTTLAKVVFDIHSSDFEGCSFIKNVKDISIVQLQQQILAEILKEEKRHIWNPESGVNMIKNRLRDKKILLVLDDVNHLDQLKYLAEKRDWFGYGSRIILTTRDQHLLNAHRVDEKHECKELNDDDSLKLFCLKAFEKEQPEEGYKEISKKIVSYIGRLPLALDVLGSFFATKGIEACEDGLKRLKKHPNQDIIKNLEISYNGLENIDREMFIYIACFLKGRNQVLVKDILESLHLNPTIGINVLIKKSLITISNEVVSVHDLLQEMCWEILKKQSPTKPSNRKGLKLREDILDVLESNKRRSTVEIINQEPSMEEVEEVANCTCNPEAFSKMRKLRFLRIQNVYFRQGIEYLSNELRILEWHGYPLKSLPSSFHPENIYELHMRYSKIEKLWEGALFFPNLRSIDLSFSENLTQTPDLAGALRLETLDLRGCRNLIEGHSSILVHKRLNYLNMAGCISLENLPSKIEMESLKILILSTCSKVRSIPEFGENVKCLEMLYLDGTTIEEIPPSIKHLVGLIDVDFSGCSKLGKPLEKLGKIVCLENLDACKTAIIEMHSSIAPMISLQCLENLCCLYSLDLRYCNLSEIPTTIGCLSSLKSLCLGGNNFVTLPASIGQLSNMTKLFLFDCKMIKSVLDIPSGGIIVPIIFVDGCTSLETLPQFLQISELGKQRKCLYKIDIFDACPKLIENDNSIAIVKCHLQGPNGRNVPYFATTFGRIIPQWFTHQRVGNYVSVELPPNWYDSTWMGFGLCACFSTGTLGSKEFYETTVSVFATMLLPDLQCIYPLEKIIVDSHIDSQVVWYVPKDTNAFERFKHIGCNQCSGHIIFYFEDEISMLYEMKCGVRLVNKEDVEELIQTTSQASIPPCLNCPKLIKNESYISVAILKRHIQEPYGCTKEFFTFNYIRGDEIPQWFTYKNDGNSISIELPPNWCDSALLGFSFYAHFEVSSDVLFDCYDTEKIYHGHYKPNPHVSIGAYVSVSVTCLLDGIQRFVSEDSVLIFYKDEVRSQAVWYVPKDRIAFKPFQQYIIAFNLWDYYWLMKWEIPFGENFGKKFGESDFKMKCGLRLVYEQDVKELEMIQANPNR